MPAPSALRITPLVESSSRLEMLSYKLGRSLQWDGPEELVVNDPQANQLLSREDRGPWQYPPDRNPGKSSS